MANVPTNLPLNPTYRKINPAEAPILILIVTSKTKTPGQMYDSASNILLERLSQLDGIGQVVVFGAALPGVRVELNPYALAKYSASKTCARGLLRPTPTVRKARSKKGPAIFKSTPTIKQLMPPIIAD